MKENCHPTVLYPVKLSSRIKRNQDILRWRKTEGIYHKHTLKEWLKEVAESERLNLGTLDRGKNNRVKYRIQCRIPNCNHFSCLLVLTVTVSWAFPESTSSISSQSSFQVIKLEIYTCSKISGRSWVQGLRKLSLAWVEAWPFHSKSCW